MQEMAIRGGWRKLPKEDYHLYFDYTLSRSGGYDVITAAMLKIQILHCEGPYCLSEDNIGKYLLAYST